MSVKEPMFNISERAPIWLAGVFITIHGLVQIIPAFIETYLAYYWVLRPLTTPGLSVLTKPISLVMHGFLHGSWTHALVNSGMCVIFGVVTIKGIKLHQTSKGKPPKGDFKFLLIFLFGVIGGGLAQWLWWGLPVSGSTIGTAALGASGGASALFASGGWALGGKAKLISFGIAWTVINLVLFATDPLTGLNIAWAAHLGGYVAGALIVPFWVRKNSAKFKITP